LATPIQVIAGLGNPGPRYSATRHNAGFMLVDMLTEHAGAGPWKTWQNIGEYCRAELPSGPLYLIKPLTYMNDSGRMLASFCGFYKLQPDSVLVCFDDMALNLGAIRLRLGGSAGGQKGMADILQCLGTQDVPRLRIGTGPRPPQFEAKDFVLASFSSQEKKTLHEALEKAKDAALVCADTGVEAAMNRFNGG